VLTANAEYPIRTPLKDLLQFIDKGFAVLDWHVMQRQSYTHLRANRLYSNRRTNNAQQRPIFQEYL